MAKFSLGKPITIGGEEVVVVRDVLGITFADKSNETYAMVEPKGADGRPAIHVSENDLTRLREDYPGIKVYGLWQILFHNNAVSFGSPIVTFRLTESNGLYLLWEGGSDYNDPGNITASGEYLNGYIPDNFDIDLSKATELDVELSSLRLPRQPAYTRLELSEKLKSEDKRRWLVIGSLCGMILVGAAATNYGLQTIYKSRMADYSTKKGLIDDLDARVRTLASERLIARPDDSEMLSRLYKFFELYPKAITPSASEEITIGFSGTHILITPNKAPVDPALVIDGVVSQLQPDLSYRVTFGDPSEQNSDELLGGDK